MRQLLRPLRVRLAIAGFAAIYTPVVVLISVIFVTSTIEEDIFPNGEVSVAESSAQTEWPAILITAAILAPIAVMLAWWWAGRAVRPVEQAIEIQEQLIEEASHELRTPLAILSTNADVVLRQADPTVELLRQGMERSRTVSARMTTIIEDLLVDARGRARTLDRKATDVAGLVKQVVETLRPVAAAASVTLAGPTSARVQAAIDPTSVERAVSNLVTNAVQHSPMGSVVTVEVAQVDQYVHVTVEDQGSGIDPDARDRVFDRYWHQQSGTGSGIGLAIVKQVADAHGGEATGASPTPNGGGSIFTITLKA